VKRLIPALVLTAVLGAARAWALECIVGGVCVLGVCTGRSTTCADNDPCTVAVCDPTLGCVLSPATGGSCDDADPCTTQDRCVAGRCVGQPVQCAADAFSCTDEVCVDGVCRSTPIDGRCATDECATGACRPRERDADRRGCVTIPRPDGEPCTDDGIACTDDVCDTATCLHVPIDGRCTTAAECRDALCAPERDDRDAAGCVQGPHPAAGAAASCVEDGDACSDDRCEAAMCRHEAVADVARCAPVRAAFRRALGLAALARKLLAEHERDTRPPGRGATVAAALGTLLRHADVELRAAAEILGGRTAVPPSREHARVLGETVAEGRARGALPPTRRAAADLRAVMRAAQTARVRGALGRARCATLRRDCHALLLGTQALESALKHVRQRTATLTR
jgi:hypothetical protein